MCLASFRSEEEEISNTLFIPYLGNAFSVLTILTYCKQMAAYLAMPVYNILLCKKAILLLLKTSNHTLTNELEGSQLKIIFNTDTV